MHEPSGAIVVAGYATTDTDPAPHLALARYKGDPAPPMEPPSAGDDEGSPAPDPLPPPLPPLPHPAFKLLAIGDSVTAGFGFRRNGSAIRSWKTILFRCRPPDPPDNRCSSPESAAYPAQLARRKGLRRSTEFRNFAVSGSTPAYWLARKRFRKILAEDPDLIVLTLGANPLLTEFAIPTEATWRNCVIGDLRSTRLRQCARRKLIEKHHVIDRLSRLYRQLVLGTQATVAVLLYYPTKPATLPPKAAAILLSELNRAIRAASREARKRLPPVIQRRFILIAPGPFSRHRCGTSRSWVLKTDFCIHPNRKGHQALALAVERSVGHLIP